MFRGMVQPDRGWRTYRLQQQCLIAGLAVAVFGIYRGIEPVGLAGIIAAVVTPIGVAAAYHSVGAAKAAASNGGNANGGDNG